MDFNVDNLWVVRIGETDIWITRTIFNTWIIMAILIVFAIVVRILLTNFKEIPRGFQNVIESLVEMFDNFASGNGGEHGLAMGSWFFSVFAFILISNISGATGFRPPTADWATAFAFAMATFILVQYAGIKYRKGKYLKSFFEPNFVFFPLNLIGELAKPISLSFRLYGNILSGLIMMSLVYSMAPIFVRIGIPVALHAYFDVIMGALQTYIFCILSLVFVKEASE